MPARTRQRRWWPWLLAGTLVVVGGGLLIAQDQETLRVQSPVNAADARAMAFVGSLLGAPVAKGDRTDVLQNGDQTFAAMLAAIDHAERRVSFESFIYSKGVVAQRFTDALARAARRGVDVRIVLDAYGSLDLPADQQEQLRQAGVQIVWFNLLRPWTVEETNYRTHRKVLAVDGRLAFVGGLGVADHWLGDAQSPDHWRDTHFRITGPSVRALEASFFENWIEAGGVSPPPPDPESPALQGESEALVIWSNPTSGASNVKLLFLLSIAIARQTVDIQSPYFILDESTRWALDDARRRGVRVRVLTEGDQTDAKPVKHASRAAYAGLLQSGYEIYEFQPTMMHVKAMVVDGVWSVIGSANFDNRSFELNDELALAVKDRRLGGELTAAFERDLARSKRLDAATWSEQRTVVGKSLEQFWRFFGELF